MYQYHTVYLTPTLSFFIIFQIFNILYQIQNTEEEDKIIISKHCKHYFHRDCIIQWLEYQKSDYKCPECRNEMITTEELREAATQLVGAAVMKETLKPQFGIGRVMREYGAPSPHTSPSGSASGFSGNPWVRDYEWGAPSPPLSVVICLYYS